MSLKHVSVFTSLTLTLVLTMNECVFTDGSVHYCDACCEYDCCGGSSSERYFGAASVGGLVMIGAIIIICVCLSWRRHAERRQMMQIHQPSSVLVVSRMIQTATPPIATPSVAGRPVYKPDVPQTGTYAYDQPITFTASPPAYTLKIETLAAEPPPPYSPKN